MAEKILIAELEIDAKATIEEQKKLGQEIESLKKSIKEARGTTKEYEETNIKNTAALQNANKQYRANQRIIAGLSAAQKGNTQTVADSRQAVSALSAEWAKSAKTFGEQDARTVKLQKELNRLNTGLKQQEGSWGNNTRSVGGYEEALAKVTGSTGALGSVFPGAAKGAGTLNKALNILKANPIILIITTLVAILRGLVKIFSRNQQTVDKFNKIMKQLSAIVDEVSARVAKFVKAFKNLLTLDFKKFGQDVKDSFTGIEDSIRSAAAAAGEIADLEVQIRKETIATTEAQAKRRKELAELILLTRDETKSFEEKRKALQQANALEVANLNEQLSLQQKTLDLKEKELASTPEFLRTDEQRQKIAEERAKLLDLETASITRQRELLNRVNELENKANAEQKAALEAERKAEEAALKVKEDAAKKNIELMNIELEHFKLTQETKLQEGKRITDELYLNEVMRLEELAAREQEINQAKFDAQLIQKEEFELRKDEIDLQFREQRAALEEERKLLEQEAALIDEENRRALMEENLLADFDIRSQLLEQQRKAEVETAKALGADVALINKKFAQFEIQLEAQKTNAKLSLASQAAGNIATIFGQESKVGKAAAIAQTTIDTFKSAQAAYSSLAGITIVGPVLGALAAAAAVAAGVANINKIKSTSTSPSGSVSTPSVSAPSVGTGRGVSSGASASTGGGLGSLSASNLGASLTTPGTGVQAAQTEAIGEGVSNALADQPPVLVLEDFQAVQGRQIEVNEGSQL